MSDNTPTDVIELIDAVDHPGRREDARTLLDLMGGASGEPPAVWQGSMVGFGRYHYMYKSGREGEWFLTGFAPRKAKMSIYVMPGFDPYADLLARLGKHKLGQSCLYVGRLSTLDLDVVRELISRSVADMRVAYPTEP